MKTDYAWTGLALLRLIAGLLLTTSAYAGQLISGELGNWLGDTAEPHLIQLITNQPRFRGEALDIVPRVEHEAGSPYSVLSVPKADVRVIDGVVEMESPVAHAREHDQAKGHMRGSAR